jgi:hypothetical protein
VGARIARVRSTRKRDACRAAAGGIAASHDKAAAADGKSRGCGMSKMGKMGKMS